MNVDAGFVGGAPIPNRHCGETGRLPASHVQGTQQDFEAAPELLIGLHAACHRRQFGVKSSPRALLDPRSWPAIIRGSVLALRGRFRAPAGRQAGGRLGLPADFLIGPDGVVLAAKYGTHADDQWSVDDVLAQAAAQR